MSREAMAPEHIIYLLYTWILEVSVGLTSSVEGFPVPPNVPIVPARTGGALAGITGRACIKNAGMKSDTSRFSTPHSHA